MSREVRRVPMDFDHPAGETWPGYLMPEKFREDKCVPCDGRGYSRFALHLQNRWYGNVPFHPSETGSTPFTPETPEVWAHAERNVAHALAFYSTFNPGEGSDVLREARRLCNLWNGQWQHHLHQDDVDVLVAEGRLFEFTHRWIEGDGWQPVQPAPTVTAEKVNRWSLVGFGHDSINCAVVVEAKCKQRGEPLVCGECDGHGAHERYPGQRAEADAWEETPPPTGEGYQLWETVSDGSPRSPVFATPDELADWIRTSGNEFDGRDTPRDKLVAWIAAEGFSAGSFVMAGGQMVGGVEFAAEHMKEASE